MGAGKNILYAPTWEGVYADSSYSSLLAIGEQLKEFCLRTDNNFIFKPHPLTGSVDEEFGSCAEQLQDGFILADYGLTEGGSIYDYFAIADVLVTDISSVLSDFLYLERPIIVYKPDFVDDLQSEFPVTRCAYVVSSSFDNIDDIFSAICSEHEPLAVERKKMRTYIMGPQSASAIDRFTEAINRLCVSDSPAEPEAPEITSVIDAKVIDKGLDYVFSNLLTARLIPQDVDIHCIDQALELISVQHDSSELRPKHVDINTLNVEIESMISLLGDSST